MGPIPQPINIPHCIIICYLPLYKIPPICYNRGNKGEKLMCCTYTFKGYPCKGAERTGGAVYETSCGGFVYGLELVKREVCMYCGEKIVVDKMVDPLNRNFYKNKK